MAEEEATAPSLDFVKQLARTAGALIAQNINDREKLVNTKLSVSDLVTQTDLEVERTLTQIIATKFPKHKFLCEESASSSDRLTEDPTWVIDPIDGTTNFVHTFPACCVSLAFVEKKETLLACVYAPVTLKQLDLSDAERQKYEYLEDAAGKLKTALVHNCRDIRHLGSSALELCYVAAGRLDAYIELGPKEWDIAAGSLIVEEAGGFVSDLDGSHPFEWHNHRVMGVCTRELQLAFCKLLADVELRDNV